MMRDKFVDLVLERSIDGSDWEDARGQWDVDGCVRAHVEDDVRCACGQCPWPLEEAYALRNNFTNEQIYPVSADCARTLGTWWVISDIETNHELMRLVDRMGRWGAWRDGVVMPFDTMLFSENLIQLMYRGGCFSGSDEWDEDIRDFLIEMLAKPAQDRDNVEVERIIDILSRFVKPWLRAFALSADVSIDNYIVGA